MAIASTTLSAATGSRAADGVLVATTDARGLGSRTRRAVGPVGVLGGVVGRVDVVAGHREGDDG